MHLLVNSEIGDLSQIVCDFKKFTSKKIIKTIQTEPGSRKDWMLNLFSFEATKHVNFRRCSYKLQIYKCEVANFAQQGFICEFNIEKFDKDHKIYSTELN